MILSSAEAVEKSESRADVASGGSADAPEREIALLRERVAALERANRRLELLRLQFDAELTLAGELQSCFLPRRLPESTGYALTASFHSAGGVSGDFYDAFALPGGRLFAYVADVMGHGMPAALLTIFLKSAIRPEVVDECGGQPERVLARINRDLLAVNLVDNPFVTMCCILADDATGELTIGCAGHPPPLSLDAEGEVREISADGPLLGVFSTEFRQVQWSPAPGSRLIVYTDGIDVGKVEGCRPGLESLKSAIRALCDRPTQELLAGCREALFSGGELEDDLTMLCVEARRRG